MSLRTTLKQLPRDARDTLFLLGVIACVLLPLFAHLPLWAGAFSCLLLAWRAGLALGGRSLPPRWLLVALLVLAVAATLASFRTILGREAGVTLIAMLLALKTLEARARRDAMVIFFLGFFTMLSNFFFSQSMPTAIAMLVALVGLLTALINAHMPVGRPPLALALRAAARMALLGTPVMVALFMFFPRMAPLWGLPGDQLTGRSGLSGSMKVGAMAALALDDTVALRVRFDLPGNALPPQSAMYFRGPVLSDFDGREWQAVPIRDTDQTPALLQVQGPGIAYEALLEPHQKPWLLLLDASPEGPQANGLHAYMARDLEWLAVRPVTEVLRYHATSYPQFRHGPLTATRELRFGNSLPAGSNPRTKALAAQMRAAPGVAGGGTQALVDAALARLRTGGYEYTLDPGVYGEHTADEFWFDRKAGFCEHIASAFVVLMRAAEVPARIVTGYQGGELNPVDGYWLVRQADAHAWSEVWLAGRGWVRVDPTAAVAPQRIERGLRLGEAEAGEDAAGRARSMVQRLWFNLDAVGNAWNQWVLSYDRSRQQDLLGRLGITAGDWRQIAALLAGVLAALIGAVALLTLRPQLPRDPVVQAYDSFCARLAAVGLGRGKHETASRYLARIARALDDRQLAEARRIVAAYEQLRYADASVDRAAVRHLRKSVQAFKP